MMEPAAQPDWLPCLHSYNLAFVCIPGPNDRVTEGLRLLTAQQRQLTHLGFKRLGIFHSGTRASARVAHVLDASHKHCVAALWADGYTQAEIAFLTALRATPNGVNDWWQLCDQKGVADFARTFLGTAIQAVEESVSATYPQPAVNNETSLLVVVVDHPVLAALFTLMLLEQSSLIDDDQGVITSTPLQTMQRRATLIRKGGVWGGFIGA